MLSGITEREDGKCGIWVQFASQSEIATFQAQRRQNGLRADAHPHAGNLIPLDLDVYPAVFVGEDRSSPRIE
jgi:hypothetical protein